jgi:hypothetical protein
VADRGRAVATDALGNTFVTGYFVNTVDFGGGDLVSAGRGDVFLAKYNATGAHLWSQRFGGTGTDEGYALAVDGSNNVLVAGVFENTVDFGGGPLVSGGIGDIFVAKYDASGAYLWSRGFGSTSNDFGFALAVDDLGNALVTGVFGGTVDFGGGGLADVGNGDVFLAKYDVTGAHLWSQRFGAQSSSSGTAIPHAISLDAADSLVVTGYFTQTIDFGGGPLTSGGANRDIFLAKYAPDGAHLWSTDFGSSMSEEGRGVALDPWGHVVLTGYFSDTVDFGGGIIFTKGGEDIFVARFGAGPASGAGDAPTHDALRLSAYPNPFNPETTVHYTIPRGGRVEVAVHDVRGARVALLVDTSKPAGSYSVRWNGRDGRGGPVASGVYFASVTFGDDTQSYKMVLTK